MFLNEELAMCFEADFNEGILRWKARPVEHFRSEKTAVNWNKKFAGKIAGGSHKEGYMVVSLTINKIRKNILVHRILWQMKHGPFDGLIDHANMIKTDNRLANLRIATPSENNANRQGCRANKYKGTTFCKLTGKYIAQINKDNKNYFLGRFKTQEEAHHAYAKAAIKLHGEFARS